MKNGGDNMTAEALKARKAYKKQWQKNNPEKVKQYQCRYWERKAAAAAAEAEAAAEQAEPENKGA